MIKIIILTPLSLSAEGMFFHEHVLSDHMSSNMWSFTHSGLLVTTYHILCALKDLISLFNRIRCLTASFLELLLTSQSYLSHKQGSFSVLTEVWCYFYQHTWVRRLTSSVATCLCYLLLSSLCSSCKPTQQLFPFRSPIRKTGGEKKIKTSIPRTTRHQ